MRKDDRAEIGRTGLRVNRLGLGGAPLAGLYIGVSEEQAHEVVNTYLDHGLGFFDTAPLYGSGVSETRLGAVLSERGRDTFVLATKVGRLLVPDPARDQDVWSDDLPPVGPVFDYSYDGTLRSLEESLGRLGLDRVDILHIHDPDNHYDEAMKGSYRALARLRDEGVIRAIGAGMNQAKMLARFAREGDFDCFLCAGRYTLWTTRPSNGCCPFARNGISASSSAVRTTAASWPRAPWMAQDSTTGMRRLTSWNGYGASKKYAAATERPSRRRRCSSPWPIRRWPPSYRAPVPRRKWTIT